MGLIIFGIIMFVLLIVVHEYGHFLVAKKNGVEVEEFGIGFPPKLYGKKLGKGIFEGYYTINLLPLGGFVKLKGEHDADRGKGTFGAASTKAKLKIMLAGVGMNLIVALILFTVVAWIGMPQLVPNQFSVKSNEKIIRSDVVASSVLENSPAAQAGIRNGDFIKSLAGEQLSSDQQYREVAIKNAGQTVNVEFVSRGESKSSQISILSQKEVEESLKTDSPKGYTGISPRDYRLAQYTWAAPVVAVGSSVQFAWLTLDAIAESITSLFKALFNAVTGQGQKAKQEAAKASENVSGPVGIFAILQQGSFLGYQFILFVVALISLTLAIMNSLPIPALDGGRVFVMMLYRVLKKPLSPKAEENIAAAGFSVLIILMILITIVDVNRFF